MNKLQNIVAYLCLSYPHKTELSKARLTKLVYLGDWFSALVTGKQLTDIEGVFKHYGPYVVDLIDSTRGVEGFSMVQDSTMYGTAKNVISFNGNKDEITLSKNEKAILDVVIDKTKELYFNSFIDYVYSTYPVRTKERYSTFDLVSLAKKYKSESPTKIK